MRHDQVSDVEIDAYLDGELDLDRRFAVEDHLAHDPLAAARVMADLSIRTALRLAQPQMETDATVEQSATRLDHSLSRRPSRVLALFGHRRLAAIAAAAIIALGLVTLSPRGAEAKPPAYVADAVMAFRTSVIRAAMVSQPESRVFDRGDVQRSTRIRIPTLPDGWQVTDVQLFPSDEGPALQIMTRTPQGRVVSIFAVRSAQIAPVKPVAMRHGDESVAYWRNGAIAYALTGVTTPEALDLAAEDIADNRLD